MTTITKERVAEIIHAAGLEPCDYEEVFGSIKTGEIVAMARIALASLEAEPVAYMHRSGQVVTREECCDDKTFAICCKVEKPLYTSQPALVSVPDAISTRQAIAKMENHDPCDSINVAYKFGWNACRAAMLQVVNL
nr:Eaa protein [Citrobacter farmeri]